MRFFSALAQKKWFPLITAIFVLIIANIVVFYKFYLHGLIPFPGNLLVSFFFPWRDGGFPGFNSWTTHKGFIASDAVRQMYPWKVFIFDALRSGHLPLWNPYNFSGYPFFGNLQSAMLFPGNILFFLFPSLVAWMILVIGSLSVFGFFNYLFFKSLKLSLPASIVGALVASSMSYLLAWQEQLIMIQVVIFLPLILWSINKFCQQERPALFFFLIPTLFCFAIFGGHAQTYIYLNLIVGPYLLFKKVPLKTIIFFLGFPAFLGAIQLLPTIESYVNSAREGAATQDLFDPFILPWKHIATVFASDYFGNPAARNYTSKFYGDFQSFFTVSGAVFAIVAIFTRFREKIVRLFIFLAVFGFLFATAPLAYLYKSIPILDSGAPSRFILMFQFSGVVLAALGFDYVWNHSRKSSVVPVVIALVTIVAIYLILWTLALVSGNFVALKNLLLPSIVVSTLLLTILLRIARPFPQKIAQVLILIALPLIAIECSYFLNKYAPFSNREFVYPNHPLIHFLQTKAGYNRFYGLGSAYFDNNFATYYHIFSTEGYDSLMTQRYEMLLASTEKGRVPENFLRSDAKFPTIDNDFRNRVFDILGVKYILFKDDTINGSWNPDTSKFPSDKYVLVWQQGKSQIYQRLTTLPRALMVSSYELISKDSELIARLYSPGFKYNQTLLLSKDPGIPSGIGKPGTANIVSYQPDKVEIETNATTSQLLFLSDTFFPGWHATVDGVSVPIFRADYDFRAVPVVKGKHRVVFNYSPVSINLGASISVLSFFGLGVITFFIFKRNKHV